MRIVLSRIGMGFRDLYGSCECLTFCLFHEQYQLETQLGMVVLGTPEIQFGLVVSIMPRNPFTPGSPMAT
jgi:hypothetical protein